MELVRLKGVGVASCSRGRDVWESGQLVLWTGMSEFCTMVCIVCIVLFSSLLLSQRT